MFGVRKSVGDDEMVLDLVEELLVMREDTLGKLSLVELPRQSGRAPSDLRPPPKKEQTDR